MIEMLAVLVVALAVWALWREWMVRRLADQLAWRKRSMDNLAYEARRLETEKEMYRQALQQQLQEKLRP